MHALQKYAERISQRQKPNGGTSSMIALTLYAQPFQTFFG